jgi:hypothetical protein
MSDVFTACLAIHEATVKAILTAAPYGHTYVKTCGPYSNGDLELWTYPAGGTPMPVGGVTDDAQKVLIHTTAP